MAKVQLVTSPFIDDVPYGEGLKHNLLSQLCDKGHKVIFEPNFCSSHVMNDNKLLFSAYRTKILVQWTLMTTKQKCQISFIF